MTGMLCEYLLYITPYLRFEEIKDVLIGEFGPQCYSSVCKELPTYQEYENGKEEIKKSTYMPCPSSECLAQQM